MFTPDNNYIDDGKQHRFAEMVEENNVSKFKNLKRKDSFRWKVNSVELLNKHSGHLKYKNVLRLAVALQ